LLKESTIEGINREQSLIGILVSYKVGRVVIFVTHECFTTKEHNDLLFSYQPIL